MSSTTIQPGETAQLTFSMHMGKGMGGMHLFQAEIKSNDPAPGQPVQLRANFID